MDKFEGTRGVWALYNTGNGGGYEATHIYEDVLDAIVGAQYHWPDRIFFWPIGYHIAEAIDWWERKVNALVNKTEEAQPGPHT